MRRRSCDKTPCSLVGKYQNTGGHITKDRLLLLTAQRTSHFKMETVQAEAQEQRKKTGIEERKTREEWKKKNRRMR